MQNTRKRLLAILLSLVMLLGLFPAAALAVEGDEDTDPSYSQEENEPVTAEIRLSTTFAQMKVDETFDIQATVTGVPADRKCIWTSNNPGVVQVDGDDTHATLNAVGPGTANVSLSVRQGGGLVGSTSMVVTVEAAVKPVKATINGPSKLTMTAGTNQTISLSASGGSGRYEYHWQQSGSVGVDPNNTSSSATIYGLYKGTGTIVGIVVDAEDQNNVDSVTWTVTVEDQNTPVTAKLDKTSLELDPGKTASLTVTASGGSGDLSAYEYYWSSSNPSVVSVNGSGKTATVQAANSLGASGGRAEIQVTVFDRTSQKGSEAQSCTVSVKKNQATYNTSASATVGSSLGFSTMAQSIANEYSNKFGENLGYSASVRFTSPSGSAGYITMQDGTRVTTSGSYSYAGMMDMLFVPTTAGTFTTGYTITQGANVISGTIRIEVSGGSGITNVSLNPSSMRLATYSSQYLSLSVVPANASYSVSWSSSDTKMVVISGSGSLVNVVTQGRTGTANVVATVRGSDGSTITRSIPVTVYDDSANRTYNPSTTITIGSDYYGTSISDSIAKQWRSYFGVALGDNATLRFDTTGNTRYGVIHLSNGKVIAARTNYTFLDLVNMYFEPYAAGTFTIPYSLTYRGDTMTGTISVNVRATSLSVSISPTTMKMSVYSNQYVYLNISPSNAYYKVAWSTSNANVAKVTGNGATATINAQGKTGTATITATITDGNGTKLYRTCSVQVISNDNGNYDPTVYTTLGVNYTGTGTSDAMASQFYNLYRMNLDNNRATISFGATGDSKIGVMHLANGTAIKANTNYTFAQYRAMYTEPVSVGTFRVPYTLTYNNQVLYGTVNVVITAGTVNCTLNLPDSLPYVFSKNLNGATGGALLSNAIRNAVGSSWSYVRFNSNSGTVGNLYQNDHSAVLNSSTNINAAAMNQLYFVPARPGTFSASFTVYNSSGGKLADGTLRIVVPGSATTSFNDVPSNAYYADAVSWALQKEVTAGTTQSTFSPMDSVTRAQAVTFLWRAMGKPDPGTTYNPFVDVPNNEYYTKAVLWAVKQGITAGTSATTFSPNDTLVQDQMLTFLCRANGGIASGPNWSDVAMGWASGRGLFNGLPSQPTAKGKCPRADVVYYLWKND